MPRDGVEDCCCFLGRALADRGIELKLKRLPWLEKGSIGALRQLSPECTAWGGKWVLIQYTAFAWSHRGFPFCALPALVILRHRKVCCAVVFREARRQPSAARLLDRFLGAVQTVLSDVGYWHAVITEEAGPRVHRLMAPENWWKRFCEVTEL